MQIKPNIPTVIFSFKFDDLGVAIGKHQSLIKIIAERSQRDDAATVGYYAICWRFGAGMENHTVFYIGQTTDNFPFFIISGIPARYQDNGRRRAWIHHNFLLRQGSFVGSLQQGNQVIL